MQAILDNIESGIKDGLEKARKGNMAREPKMQHCFNCGAEIGVYVRYTGDEPECCGRPECRRKLRYQVQAEEADRRDRAEQDGYERYA